MALVSLAPLVIWFFINYWTFSDPKKKIPYNFKVYRVKKESVIWPHYDLTSKLGPISAKLGTLGFDLPLGNDCLKLNPQSSVHAAFEKIHATKSRARSWS